MLDVPLAEYNSGDVMEQAFRSLYNKDNNRSSAITQLVDAGCSNLAEWYSKNVPQAFNILNSILQIAGLNVQINVGYQATMNVSRTDTNNNTNYLPSEMSEGERSAWILGALVITADPGSIL